MRFDIDHKWSVNLYDVMTKIEQVTGLFAKMVMLNTSSFLTEATSKKQASRIPQIDKTGEYQCETTKYDRFNCNKGLI